MKGKQITVKYSENLRDDFVLCCIKIKYINTNLEIIEAYINHYEFGIIKINNWKKEIHKWENEDQSQNSSYLSRRYTVTLLNGITNDIEYENKFIYTVIEFIKNSKLDLKSKNVVLQILNNILLYR